uniref:Uncharacterized protein LOC114348690 n=1 Tax=Diabrotica virgifera virgifera TaxID=50390 RepID=A0A6P7GZ36_DIAVI
MFSQHKQKITDLLVKELRNELEERDMDTTGKKADLVERLKNVLQEEGQDPETYLFKDKHAALISKVSGEISLVSTDITSLENKVSTDITPLENKLSGEISQVSTDITSLENKVSGEISQVSGEISKVSSDVSKVSTDVTSLKNRVIKVGNEE